jgi:hypothetical protein
MSYLFRYASGDCFNGCTYNEFLYFTVTGCRPKLVGTWKPTNDSNPPSWWSEAEKNWEQFTIWRRCEYAAG